MRWTKQRELISRHYNNNPAGKRKKEKFVESSLPLFLVWICTFHLFGWLPSDISQIDQVQTNFFISQEAISFQKLEGIIEISSQDTEVTQNFQNRDTSTCTIRLNSIYCKSIPTTRSDIELVKDMIVEDHIETPC